MGDCDKMNKHISAYIENTLDPSTRAEFDKDLEKYPQFRKTAGQVLKLSSRLEKLPDQKCSENFMIKLREKINTEPARNTVAINVKRYSFAFSFIILAIIAVFSINRLLNKEESVSSFPPENEMQVSPSSVTNRPGNTNVGDYSGEGEMEVKTQAESNAVKDSITNRKTDQDNSRAKVVGHTK